MAAFQLVLVAATATAVAVSCVGAAPLPSRPAQRSETAASPTPDAGLPVASAQASDPVALEHREILETLLVDAEHFRPQPYDFYRARHVAIGLQRLRDWTKARIEEKCRAGRTTRCKQWTAEQAQLDAAHEGWCAFLVSKNEECPPPYVKPGRGVDIDLDEGERGPIPPEEWNCGVEAVEQADPDRLSVDELLRELPKPDCVAALAATCPAGDEPVLGGCIAAGAAARVNVDATKPATVFIDGCRVGPAPQSDLRVRPGFVTVSLVPARRSAHWYVVTKRRRLAAGETASVSERICEKWLRDRDGG